MYVERYVLQLKKKKTISDFENSEVDVYETKTELWM